MANVVLGVSVGLGVVLLCAALLAAALVVISVLYAMLRRSKGVSSSSDELAASKQRTEVAELNAKLVQSDKRAASYKSEIEKSQKGFTESRAAFSAYRELIEASDPFLTELVEFVDDLDESIKGKIDTTTGEPFVAAKVIVAKQKDLDEFVQDSPPLESKAKPELDGLTLGDTKYLAALVTVVDSARAGIAKVNKVGEEFAAQQGLDKKDLVPGTGGEPQEELASASSLGRGFMRLYRKYNQTKADYAKEHPDQFGDRLKNNPSNKVSTSGFLI